MSLGKGTRKLIENPGKLNLVQKKELTGSKYAIIKKDSLYVSPAMIFLIKNEDPKSKTNLLKTLEVYNLEASESITSASLKLVKLSAQERQV